MCSTVVAGPSSAARSNIRSAARYFAFDPPGWHREADAWADAFGEVVVAFPTSTRSRMASACSRFYAAVMGGQLAHDGDARLARHLANAVLRDTADGGYITKDGPNSPRKVDAAIAAVVAHERGVWHLANPRREVGALVAWR